MSYNTGNPIGSTDPRDLSDNAQNLDIAANSQAATWTDRLGVNRPTIAGAIDPSGLAQEAANSAARAETARDAAQLSAGVYATTALGLAATVSGGYFSVPSVETSEYLILYSNGSGAAIEKKRYPSAAVSSIDMNIAKPYPLKQATRDGITSAPSTKTNLSLLDIKVIGARAGKLYKVEWIGSGTTALGSDNSYAILFNEYDKSTYGTDSASGKKTAVDIGDFSAPGIEAGGVITRTFASTRIEGLVFIVTYRPGSLATGFTPMNNNSAYAAWSWIIDENCYIGGLTTDSELIALSRQASLYGLVAYSHTDSETVMAWRYSATQDIKVSIGRYGVNMVNDIGEIAFKDNYGGPVTTAGAWTVMTARATDWIGPFIVNAIAGGSGSVTQFTGANHGYTGGSGAPTAEQTYRRVYVDGRQLSDGEAGSGRQVSFQWENLVQGSNTRDVPRYILREQHSFIVRPGSIETSARVTAMEGVTVSRYYGLQAYISGFNSSVHFLNGQQSGRINWADGLSSGGSGSYPSVFAANVRGASGFNLLLWMDRGYGVASTGLLNAASDMFFTGSSKIYTRLIDENALLAMAVGDSFCWRGGYSLSENLGVNIDIGARYYDGGDEVIVAALTTAGAGRVSLPTPDSAGRVVAVRSGAVQFSDRVEPDGVAVSATGYAVGVAAA